VKRQVVLLAGTIAACTMLAGCDSIKGMMSKKPEGQVVATVNGQEITALELKSELGNFTSPDPAVMKRAQQAALQQIILRNLLVQKAKEDKLDKTPSYAVQIRRGEQNLLAQAYQQKLAVGVAVPTRADAETYIAAHPAQFANRQILTLEQVISPQSKLRPEQFQPIKTMEELKALLVTESIPYQENVATIDTLTADPKMAEEIGKLPPGEIFVVPQRTTLIFNKVSSTRTAPFRGDPAVNYAINLLRQQRAQDTVRQRIEVLRKSAESKIVYNDAYKDLKPAPAGVAPKAPAAAPAATAPAPVPKA